MSIVLSPSSFVSFLDWLGSKEGKVVCFYLFPLGLRLWAVFVYSLYFKGTVFGASSSCLKYILLSIKKKKNFSQGEQKVFYFLFFKIKDMLTFASNWFFFHCVISK